jgi:hypothetical protein
MGMMRIPLMFFSNLACTILNFYILQVLAVKAVLRSESVEEKVRRGQKN